MDAIEARALRRVYGEQVVAVDSLDLDVRTGEFFAFLGPNGAGKTTAVRMLTTLLRPTSGSARVAGHDIRREAREVRNSIGVALQEAGLDALSTGRELIEMQARIFGMKGNQARDRADELLQLVGLSEAADRLIQTYSGGMKRRLDLASALTNQPQVLFLDEPTEGLDPASRQAIWDEVRRLNKQEGITVFLTTHYLEEADKLADRIAIIDRGRIVVEGSPTDLKGSIGTDVVTAQLDDGQAQVALGILHSYPGIEEIKVEGQGVTLFVKDGAVALVGILRSLDEASVKVGAVTVATPTLDEVFLRATGQRLEGAETSGPRSQDVEGGEDGHNHQ